MANMNSRVVFGRQGDIEYSLYRDEDLSGVTEVLLTSFLLHESVAVANELHLPENEASRLEVVKLAEDFLRNGVSIVARDVTKNKIVGLAINSFETHKNHEPYYFADVDQSLTSVPSRTWWSFNMNIDLLQVYGVDCLFEIIMLGTLPGHSGAGIGRNLCAYSVELAQRLKDGECFEHVSDEIRLLGCRPQVVAGIFSSTYSQRIGAQLGLQTNGSVQYAEKVLNGKTFAERINDARHSAALLMSKRL